jgi:PAS domain S-box-containing protein
MAGLSLEEAQGEGWIQGLHPDDREGVLACWQKMVRSRGRWGHEYRFLTGEGKVTWVFGLATPQFDANGEIIAYIGINTDITERKQAEAMLRESEERYRSLFDSAPDGLMLTAPGGRIFSANKSLCHLLGRTEAEIIQIGRSGIMDTSDPRLALALEERTSTGRLKNVELTCVRKDGLKIPVELSSTVFQDKDGNARTSIIVHDITERKAGELRLQQQADFTRRVLDSTAAHIVILDAEGVIIDVNTPWSRFARENNGAELEKFGPGASYFCPWSPEFGDTSNAAPAFEGIRQVQRGERETFQIEYPCHSPEEDRWFTMLVQPLIGTHGQVLVSHTDITSLKQTEEHLTSALAEKDVLLREVHHRVKNNLAAIIGLLDMQRRLLEDAQGQDFLAELGDRIRSMSLIHEKLYQAGNLARVNFQEYLQSLVSHLRASLGSPGIHFQTDALGVELPLDLAVPCGMIVNELITNAMKHAFPNGQPAPGRNDCHIRVDMRLEDGTCTLCVADNGVGLPPGFNWTSATTLGMVLVRMLGRHQLGGSYVLEQHEGFRLTLTFNEQRGKI